jgi:hypothetical protein
MSMNTKQNNDNQPNIGKVLRNRAKIAIIDYVEDDDGRGGMCGADLNKSQGKA